MNQRYYQELVTRSLAAEVFSSQEALDILTSSDIELLSLVHAAFCVRQKYWGRTVRIHIINNAENGHCSEDCSYCAQGQSANKEVLDDYPIKSDEEIMSEARSAYEAGAFRYCMVFSGRGPSDKRVAHLAGLVKSIKEQYPIEVCVSPGLLKSGQAEILKEAGLNRLNHNINTTEELYGEICQTHGYADRLATLDYAKTAGLELCSGMIVGMGEGPEGVVGILQKLAQLQVESIPINFFMSLPQVALNNPEQLTPQYCLRVLCAARLMLPKTEIRAAGGREVHLRGLQSLALYPANSIFMQGYLNVAGDQQRETLQMIDDAGFEIECDEGVDVQQLLKDCRQPVITPGGCCS